MKKKERKTKRAKVIAPEVVAVQPENYESDFIQRNLPVPVNVNPQALMAQAISSNLPVEQLERLMSMRRELKAEWGREQFFIALSKFQSEVPQIQKTQAVMIGGKARYKFPPIEHVFNVVEPFLEKNGFSYSFETEQTTTDVTSICVARHRDGHEERSKFAIPIAKNDYMTAQQHVASAISYADRYSFKRLFGLVFCGEDDDTNGFDKGDKSENKPPTLPVPPGKVPWPSKKETKPKPSNTVASEIPEHEKAVAYAKRINELIIAECEGDETKRSEWLLRTTAKLKAAGKKIQEHAKFRTMQGWEIIDLFELIRDQVEKFEDATVQKEVKL